MAVNPIAIGVFFAFIVVTLIITAWSSRRARSAAQFYTADGSITPLQNGVAIAGDYLSAASFLGTIAVFFSLGIDGLIYAVGAAAGWPVVMCLIAERLRNLGRYTFADVLCRRLADRPVRTLTGISTLCICGTYLVAQMVGAGALVQILFGIRYEVAVTLVGSLMIVYVMCGGMVATTWIQIVKATVLLTSSAFMVLALLALFGFDFGALAASAAHTRSDPGFLLRPSGLLLSDPLSAAGLALAFAFGPAGMPHILMRFFTVKDGASARRSLVYASCIIAVFQAIVIVLGYGALALVSGNESYADPSGTLVGGVNMAAVHLAHRLGGSVLFGIVAAVTFATILAVVSGLTLAAASAISHDLYKNVLRKGRASEAAEVRVSRISCVAIGMVAIGLGLVFRNQNVGFLATLPLVIAASANFPILLLAMYWRGLTTAGATWGGLVGLVLSTLLMLFSPKVWVDALGHADSWFPYEYPTVVSMGCAFLVAWLVSRADKTARATRERAAFGSLSV